MNHIPIEVMRFCGCVNFLGIFFFPIQKNANLSSIWEVSGCPMALAFVGGELGATLSSHAAFLLD